MGNQTKTVRVVAAVADRSIPTVNIRTSGPNVHATHSQAGAVNDPVLRKVQPNTGPDSRAFKTIIIPGYVAPQ